MDIFFATAIAPPGCGRNPTTPRLLRHFSVVTFTELSTESLAQIFGAILGTFLEGGCFTDEVCGMKMSVVLATVEVYRAICEQMLPTPARLHYTFNLRDPSKVIQGLLRAEPAVS